MGYTLLISPEYVHDTIDDVVFEVRGKLIGTNYSPEIHRKKHTDCIQGKSELKEIIDNEFDSKIEFFRIVNPEHEYHKRFQDVKDAAYRLLDDLLDGKLASEELERNRFRDHARRYILAAVPRVLVGGAATTLVLGISAADIISKGSAIILGALIAGSLLMWYDDKIVEKYCKKPFKDVMKQMHDQLYDAFLG